MNRTLFLLSLLTSLLFSQETDYIVDDVRGQEAPMEQQGVLELKNKKTVLSVGGRIQLHAIYGWPEGAFYAGRIPMSAQGENGQLIMSARDSRFWVKTRTPTEYGVVRALIETDFLGSSGTETVTNSHNLRLRHAYFELAGFTIGQTNSAFNSSVTLDTITFPINHTFVRQPLIRYTIDTDAVSYDFSFEQPETTLTDSSGAIITPQDDIVPDFITRLRYYPSFGEMSIAFLARYINQDYTDITNGNTNSQDRALGLGVNASLKWKIHGLDDIRLNAQYGIGMGRYLSFNAFSAGELSDSGHITLDPSYGAFIGYRHFWNKKLRSNIALSYSGTQNTLQNTQDLSKINKEIYGAQLNLLWTPLKNMLSGLEYSKGIRYVESGDRGDVDMLTLLVRYDF